ncbi:superoxide dismutase [Patescibacteria group bacterium]|nr:superoxide dismutase [Patescibacteria group bacterium]
MYKLPDLPYKYDALEPYIDELTIRIHHDKHHQGYVDNLNRALSGHKELLDKPVEKLLAEIDRVPEDIKLTVINNGGGHSNHSLFWEIMLPAQRASSPEGVLKEALNKHFGSFNKFREALNEKAMTVFGSGWAFLIVTSDGSLSVKRHSFQNSPYMHGNVPILGLDVWEHAYYLKYQNRRADYVDAWWHVVNWDQVGQNFKKASKSL